MIGQQLLETLRGGICAIGYTTVPIDAYSQNLRSPFLKVVGTGFLVRETVVLTCRHVVNGLQEAQEEQGFPDDQKVLVFITPLDGTGVNIAVCPVQSYAFPDNPDLDIALVGFARLEAPQFADVKPLPIRRRSELRVTQQVAVCGYPYGHAMLQRNRRVYRWGPVVQQGHLSALSPFDNVAQPEEMLLDVRVAGGMSGAPIFLPDDAAVIGILTSTWEATIAIGIPITEERLSQWLARFDETLSALAPASPHEAHPAPLPPAQGAPTAPPNNSLEPTRTAAENGN